MSQNVRERKMNSNASCELNHELLYHYLITSEVDELVLHGSIKSLLKDVTHFSVIKMSHQYGCPLLLANGQLPHSEYEII